MTKRRSTLARVLVPLGVLTMTAGAAPPAHREGGTEIMLSVIEHPRVAVSEYLAGAADSVSAVQYKLTDAGLLGSLRALLRRGIEVRLLLDGREASDGESLWRPLAKAGAEVRLWPSEKRGKLHAKFTVIDGSRVLTGSNNWTTKGLDENVEVVMALEDSIFVKEFESFFQRLWSEGKPVRQEPQ